MITTNLLLFFYLATPQVKVQVSENMETWQVKALIMLFLISDM